MERKVSVTFTEKVTRTYDFVLEVEDDLEFQQLEELDYSDIHEMLDNQGGWDQPTKEDWLAGDIEDRTIGDVTWFAFEEVAG